MQQTFMKRNLQLFFRNLTPVQTLVLIYSAAAVLSVLLLALPIAHKPGVTITFTDLVFFAVSCVSVTGLTPIVVTDTFSTFGLFIILFIVQVSGVGLISLHVIMWILLGKRIGFRERQLILRDQNQTSMSGIVKYITEIVITVIAIEAVGAVLLGVHYLNYFDTAGEAFLQGLFGSISATTNAGFDITGSSLAPFREDPFVIFTQIALMTGGAIGFPVLVEIRTYLVSRITRKRHTFPSRFSLFTKLTVSTFFLLIAVGTVGLFIFEYNNAFKDLPLWLSLSDSLFQSVTTRNGGLSTVDVNLFSEASMLLLSILMFIGASPSSVGGGIRTTTFAVAVLGVVAFIRGDSSIKIFGREIVLEDIWKAFVIITVSLAVLLSGVMVMAYFEDASLTRILFEACSAFGTTGLSVGLSSEFSNVGKWVLTILMFIGRIGVIAFILILQRRQPKRMYNYPKESIILG